MKKEPKRRIERLVIKDPRDRIVDDITSKIMEDHALLGTASLIANDINDNILSFNKSYRLPSVWI